MYNSKSINMRNFKSIILVAIVMVCSCTDDFEEINTNNNQPETVGPNLILAEVISSSVNRVTLLGEGQGNVVAQLTAIINFTEFDRYLWGSETGLWNDLYGNLPELEIILQISREEATKNTSYEGIALVLKSWIFSILTDNWGPVPYSEAIKGQSDGNFQPVYDSQENIYNGILADLATADGLLAQGQAIFGGDLLYNGDVTKWRKLANSLRLRYLLRASNKMNVSAQMQSIVDAGNIFESNDDNAVMQYPATTQVDSWPISTQRIGGFDENRLSQTSEAILKMYNDNRLFTWFQPTDNPDDDPALFVGLPNGLSEDNATTFNGGAKNVSRLNQSLFFDSPNSVRAALMQFAEMQFILAEAAQQSLITGDAKAYYESGVAASFEYWSTDQDMAVYLAQAGVAYDGNLETIITQKWLASFLVGMEAWYDFRRTGFPSVIVPGPDNVNGDVVPVRFLYPDVEQSLNGDNYQQAVAALGGDDDINGAGWWESN